MKCVKKLKAALAAVPVSSQPCTAAAVATLFVGTRDARQQLVPVLSQTAIMQPVSDMAEEVASQQLPGACMPVLAWLEAGLRSGLPAPARQQALDLASVLLGVVTLAIPGSLLQPLVLGAAGAKELATRGWQQLGDLGACAMLLVAMARSPATPAVLAVMSFPCASAGCFCAQAQDLFAAAARLPATPCTEQYRLAVMTACC
jgi:hypothetical protein